MAQADSEPQSLGATQDAALTLFLAGDVMTGRGVDQVLRHSSAPELRESYVKNATRYVEFAQKFSGPISAPVPPEYIWGDALDHLKRFNPGASIVNLETSITRSDDFWPGKAVHYRMHPANVDSLRAARIDVCTLANNHVLDFGYAGLAETLATLRESGIASAGAGSNQQEARRPARVALPGGAALWVFALGLSSSGIPPAWAATATRAGVDLLPDLSRTSADAVVARVRQRKRAGDLALISIHWGSNWGYEVEPEHIEFAHALLDGGADVVLGHSSHHVRPIEVYRGKLILYGAGDLVTDYEGIGGHREWRGDLGAMYFARISAERGTLRELVLSPMQMKRLKLTRAADSDVEWLKDTLNRISAPFGARFERREDDLLIWRAPALSDTNQERSAVDASR